MTLASFIGSSHQPDGYHRERVKRVKRQQWHRWLRLRDGWRHVRHLLFCRSSDLEFSRRELAFRCLRCAYRSPGISVSSLPLPHRHPGDPARLRQPKAGV